METTPIIQENNPSKQGINSNYHVNNPNNHRNKVKEVTLINPEDNSHNHANNPIHCDSVLVV